MANPRQRRKARSSAHKPTRTTNANKLRKRPPIKGPQVLQKAWDKTKTVRQNYLALGLLADVNSLKPSSSSLIVEDAQQSTRLSAAPAVIHAKTGRILRDSVGKVIGVEIPEDDEPSKEAVGSSSWSMSGSDRQVAPVLAKTAVAIELEGMAAGGGEKKQRTASMHQLKWLGELVKVHGEDIDAMVRDRRRNVWQKTTGELRRAIMMAGGIEVLRSLGS